MNRENSSGKDAPKHISMELTADAARVTNLSLEGSRLVLTIEAELAASQLRSSDAPNREAVAAAFHPSTLVGPERLRDDTEVVRHVNSADAPDLGQAKPPEFIPGALAMGSESLPPAPAAYAPAKPAVTPLGPTTAAYPAAPNVTPTGTEDIKTPSTPADAEKPKSTKQCEDGDDTQEVDFDKSRLESDGTDTISLDDPNSPMFLPPHARRRTPTQNKQMRRSGSADTIHSDTGALAAALAEAAGAPPPLPPMPTAEPAVPPPLPPPLPAQEEAGSTTVVQPPVMPKVDETAQPWQPPELEEQKNASAPPTSTTPAPESQLAMSEESSAIGGSRHGEPQPAISFGQDAPFLDFPTPPPLRDTSSAVTTVMTPDAGTPPAGTGSAPTPGEPTSETPPAPPEPVPEATTKPTASLPPVLPQPEGNAETPSEKPSETPKAEEGDGDKKPEGGTTVLIRYTCPKCKTQGMQAVDKVGTVVNCSNCGKAMRLVMKK